MQYFGFDRPRFAFKTYGFGANPDAAILALFSGGKKGVWYDPSDKSTLFQDVAGTVPVTKDGDPIGLMKDKSGNGYHATQSVSAARPLYRTDGALHWFDTDAIDDSLVIPMALGGKTFTLGLGYTPVDGDAFVLVNSIINSNYALVATKDNTSTGLSVSATINFIKTNGMLRAPVNRGELHALLTSSNAMTSSITYVSDWGDRYGYSSFSAKSLRGFKRTTAYIMVENLTDTTELDKYLAKKSGVTL